MACPICERVYCDHTPEERGQTHDEMMADCYGMTVEEYRKGMNPLAPTEKKPGDEGKGEARQEEQ